MSEPERRLAVIDLGSNSFRLVVFSWVPGAWWKRTDEIHESVRVGEGLEATGALQEEPMERALETLELYAHFCSASVPSSCWPAAIRTGSWISSVRRHHARPASSGSA